MKNNKAKILPHPDRSNYWPGVVAVDKKAAVVIDIVVPSDRNRNIKNMRRKNMYE